MNVNQLALVLLLALAVAWDLNTRRIPNVLTIGGCLIALSLRAIQGPESIGFGFLGLALGLLVSLPFVVAGGLGGGDAKLLAAVGAFLGPEQLWAAILVMGLVGGVMALLVAMRSGEMYDTLRRTWGLAGRMVGIRAIDEPRRTLATAGALTIPYAVPIAIGAILSQFYV